MSQDTETVEQLDEQLTFLSNQLENEENEKVATELLEQMEALEDRKAELEGTSPPPTLTEDDGEPEAETTDDGEAEPELVEDPNPFASYDTEEVKRLGAVLAQNIVKIGKQTDANLRSVVDQFRPCVSPAFARNGTDRFPREYKTRPNDPLKCSVSEFGDVLCFLIGRAIQGYYNLINGEPEGWETQAIRMIAQLASDDLSSYRVWGSKSKGYELLPPHAVKERIRQQEEQERQIQEAKNKRFERQERAAKRRETERRKALEQEQADEAEDEPEAEHEGPAAEEQDAQEEASE